MDNLFLKYMQERTGQRKSPDKGNGNPGPVITISREFGCGGRRVASLLCDKLNEKAPKAGLEKEWRMISKEILDRSAHELKVTPELMRDLKDYKQKSFFENLALFFSDEYYPGDAKIKNTMAKFLHEEAEEGKVIILGRASEAITKDIKKSFHIKLEAPLEWRANWISKENHLSLTEARKLCSEQDKRRAQFRNYFEKGRPDIDFFDLRINVSTMSVDEIVDMLIRVVELKGLIK